MPKNKIIILNLLKPQVGTNQFLYTPPLLMPEINSNKTINNRKYPSFNFIVSKKTYYVIVYSRGPKDLLEE